ncbi:MAG: hypothetical protein IJK02_07110 [Clostridia bacterium]|nr:hypothetical protein [Clostridia bacterium]MBR0509247.1 hypothetical protein [Clostridia bacterium]MBR0538353.1 hypothetical protein [Clostridia bacterium]
MLFMSQIVPLVLFMLLLGGGIAAAVLLFIYRDKPTKKEIMAEGIRLNVQDFNGMFEPVYSISVGKNQKQEEVFTAFTDAVRDSEEDNGYKRLVSETFGDFITWGKGKKKLNVKKRDKIYQKKAHKLVKIFFKAGVLRADDLFVTVDDTTAEKYEFSGGQYIEPETTCEVLSPVWTLDNVVVNKGVIR